MNQHIPELNSLLQPNFLITQGIFLPAIFSLHKQCLQSESALIKGTNLSRSNQVASLGRAADNFRLFDQKYIIFSRAACLDAFVWGQEIGEVIAPCWCSSSPLCLLAGKMKASPIISENTPNELKPTLLGTARATYAPVSSLFAVYVWWYKRYCRFLSPPPLFFKWNETFLRWCRGAIEVASESSGLLRSNLVSADLISWSSWRV